MAEIAAPHTAVVVVNLGSTAAPTAQAIRRFLGEFLADRRIVDLPRLVWFPILYGIILTFRPRKLTGKYASIWMTRTPKKTSATKGKTSSTHAAPTEVAYEKFQSPLMVYTTSLAKKLELALAKLNTDAKSGPILVRDAMTYGEYRPVDAVLTELHQTYPSVKEVVVLPLFAQYTSTTVACIFDTFFRYYGDPHRRFVPGLQLIRDYPTNHAYIDTIGQGILRSLTALYTPASGSWLTALQKALPTLAIVVSFHSIPCQCANEGDDYVSRCEATMFALQAWLECALAAASQKEGNYTDSTHTWSLEDVLLHVYQSQFGKAPWIGPSLECAMKALPEAPLLAEGSAADTNTSTTTPTTAKDMLVEKMHTFYDQRAVRAETWRTKQVKDCIVVAPGFAVDCIETLVEIQEEARESFLEHGGSQFEYVPCLNDSDDHVRVLCSVLKDATRLPL